jgi:hypothetical protein
LKGHGFSRADKANKMSVALATEGWFFSKFSDIFDFFSKLFSRAIHPPEMTGALAPAADPINHPHEEWPYG